MIRPRASSGRDAPPPPGEYCSETNDNSVAILLNYSTPRVLLAGNAEAREEYMASARYTRP
jgi:beta-lactamase superfamily II metal-dependent hydrolase